MGKTCIKIVCIKNEKYKNLFKKKREKNAQHDDFLSQKK